MKPYAFNSVKIQANTQSDCLVEKHSEMK